MTTDARSTVRSYALALAAAAIAAALLRVDLPVTLATLIFFFATVASAWGGGFRPGLLTVTLILISVVGRFEGAFGLLQLGLFVLQGVLLCALIEAMRLARARAEEQAESAGEIGRRFRLLFELSPHAMWVHDVESARFLEVNAEASRLYGYSAEEFRAMTVGDLLPTAPGTPQPLALDPEGGSPVFDRVWRHRTRDGRLLDVETRSSEVRLGGRPARIVLATDVTERRRAQRELEAAREAAETANRAKDHFLAALSHELRAPLTPVLAEATARLDDPDTPPSLRPMFEMFRRNVELESRLIDDLFDVVRIDRGKLRLRTELVDIHALLERALEICSGELRAGRFRIERRFSARFSHVTGDPARLQQVFWNLLKNAAKFTPEGGWIGVRTADVADSSGRRLLVEVIDTGSGIEPEFLPRVFDAFAQEDAADRRRFGGLGLGLAISRSIVEAHGGRIAAHSPGRGLGATFAVELTGVCAEACLEPNAPPTPATRRPAEAGPLHILFVEDHADTLQILSRLLRRRGHRVETAGNCAEAMEAFRAGRFDLIVADLGLPDGSGLDLLPRLRAIRPTPAIALSGFGGEADAERSLAAGFDLHLTKPVEFAALEGALVELAPPRFGRKEVEV